MNQILQPRGSEWRRWDLHVHTPASFGYKGSYDELVRTLVSCEADVLGINDYCSFAGYEEILRRGGIKNKVLFPVIEFRMHNIVANRKGAATHRGTKVNFHIIFNNEPAIFKRAKVWLASLECYNAQSNTDQLGNIPSVDIDKITFDFDKVITSLEKLGLRKDVLVWLPYDEYGGIDDVDPKNNFFKLGLIKRADVMGSSTEKQIEFFLWKDTKFKPEDYKNWLEKPLPCIKGSDSHEAAYPVGRLKDMKSNPVDRYCWIKADPTFEGLRQITVEPEDRIYIGRSPQKLIDVAGNKSRYIDKIKISHITKGHSPSWFNDEISLNSGLVAIIGKKGSGKSALADIIALSGKSSIPPAEYSFLAKEKFRKKDLAKNYASSLSWLDVSADSTNLNDEVDSLVEVEKVKYLPQHFVETICNENGVSSLFQDEIDKVIFSYVPLPERLNARNLNELISIKASVVDELIVELRENLKNTNFDIVQLEQKASAAYKTRLDNELAEKEREFKALVPPKEVKKPKQSDPATQKEVKDLSEKIEDLKNDIKTETEKLTETNEKLAKLKNIRESIQLLNEKTKEYLKKLEDVAKHIPLDLKDVIKLEINTENISNKEKELTSIKKKIEEKLDQGDEASRTSLYKQKERLQRELDVITQLLGKDQKAYQEYLKAVKDFQDKREEILGKEGDGNLKTITSIKEEIAYLEKDLAADLEKFNNKRINIVKNILSQLRAKIEFYKEIYKPLINFVEQERKLQEKSGNILDFSVGLNFDRQKFSDQFFAFINQNRDGSFQGKENGQKLLKSILDKFNFSTGDGILKLINEVIGHLRRDVTKKEVDERPIDAQLKADKKELYDFLFGLEYLNVQYTILFNGKDLNDNEFSPGEKGALLLIFYLLIDKNRTPLIMDQPEENLDNESVYKLLVPYIKKAKQTRQIFVVTHNPNIAVVCDAEQIVSASMNKKTSEIRYVSGSIENALINRRATDVLEGTLPAFDIRNSKYVR